MSVPEILIKDGGDIAGNAPAFIKNVLANPLHVLMMVDGDQIKGFGVETTVGLRVTEVDIKPNAEEPSRDEARVVCRLVVNEGMLNGIMGLHGGCSAYLVDICSTFAILAYIMAHPEKQRPNVSQAITVTYHSPAHLGDELKIVNTTMSVGSKSMVARTEIWNATKKRLAVSGVHIKMEPSPPKSAKL